MQNITGQKRLGGFKQVGTLATLLIVAALPLALGIFSISASDKAGQAIAANEPGALAWEHDYKQALGLAAANNKPLLIDVYTDWCGWCKKLDRDTYSNADVQAFLSKNFVLLKLNAEDGADGQAVAKKFHVNGYPCGIVMDAQGKSKGIIYGYFTPKEYLAEVSKVLSKSK